MKIIFIYSSLFCQILQFFYICHYVKIMNLSVLAIIIKIIMCVWISDVLQIYFL